MKLPVKTTYPYQFSFKSGLSRYHKTVVDFREINNPEYGADYWVKKEGYAEAIPLARRETYRQIQKATEAGVTYSHLVPLE